MNERLRQILSSNWKTLCCAWAYRREILALISDVEALRDKTQPLMDQLHLKDLEIAHLKELHGKEELAHNKTRNYMRKLVTFIAIRHRIDTPAQNGTIRQQLQQLESRK